MFGAAQSAGIRKDINSLLNGKIKSGISIQEHLKFMVFLDLPEVRSAAQRLFRTTSFAEANNINVEIVDSSTLIESSKKVYVVFVSV